eukprot:5281883-Pleurochrysis_carterae.AAC.2
MGEINNRGRFRAAQFSGFNWENSLRSKIARLPTSLKLLLAVFVVQFHLEWDCERSQTGSICDVAWQLGNIIVSLADHLSSCIISDCFVRVAAKAENNDVLAIRRSAGDLAAPVLDAVAE